jgi:cytochrome c-type biogenesis protein CcmH
MKALALAGTVEIKANNRDGALKYWQKLRGLVAPNSDDSREIDNIIADVKSGKAMRGPVVASNSATDFSDAPNPHAGVAGAPQTTTGGPSGAPAAPPSASPPAAAPAPAAGSARVTGLVLLDPALISKVTGNETLFVFARAVNGPKMPLAVLRVPVPTKWPFVFELTDAMAMAPGMNLSSFPQVTIDARISKSGNAIPAPGDLAGQSAPITPRTLNVPVNISRVVP